MISIGYPPEKVMDSGIPEPRQWAPGLSLGPTSARYSSTFLRPSAVSGRLASDPGGAKGDLPGSICQVQTPDKSGGDDSAAEPVPTPDTANTSSSGIQWSRSICDLNMAEVPPRGKPDEFSFNLRGHSTAGMTSVRLADSRTLLTRPPGQVVTLARLSELPQRLLEDFRRLPTLDQVPVIDDDRRH